MKVGRKEGRCNEGRRGARVRGMAEGRNEGKTAKEEKDKGRKKEGRADIMADRLAGGPAESNHCSKRRNEHDIE